MLHRVPSILLLLALLSSTCLAGKHRVVARLPTGIGPGSLELTPDGTRVAVCNSDSGDLSVFRLSDLSASATIPVGRVPVALAFDRSGAALVLNTSSDRLHVVDPAQAQAAGELDDKLGYGLWHAQLTPDGKRMLISGWVSNTLAVVSSSPAMSYALIPLSGKGACQMAVAPDGERAYVAHSESDTLVAVDLVGLREVGSVPVGRFPFSYVAVSPDGADVMVTNDKDGTVSVIDAATLTVRQVIPVGSIPRQILFVGTRALVTCAFSNHLAVLERE